VSSDTQAGHGALCLPTKKRRARRGSEREHARPPRSSSPASKVGRQRRVGVLNVCDTHATIVARDRLRRHVLSGCATCGARRLPRRSRHAASACARPRAQYSAAALPSPAAAALGTHKQTRNTAQGKTVEEGEGVPGRGRRAGEMPAAGADEQAGAGAGDAGPAAQDPEPRRAPAPAPDELVVAHVGLSLPTRVLGLCWYVLAWLLLPPGLVANTVLALCCGLWVGSEICRFRRFYAQEHICRHIMGSLSVSAFYVSRARSDNLRQLQQLAKDVVACTTQTPARCVLESLVVMTALWMASILPGLLWEVGLDMAMSRALASLSGTDWLAQTARLTDDAELLKLIDQLSDLDKALAAERSANPAAMELAEHKWKAKWGTDPSSPWSDVLAAASGLSVLQDSGEALLHGAASFVGALVLWWLLRRCVRRRMEHRLIMTRAGCVGLLINIMASEQPALAGLPAQQPARADAGAVAQDAAPAGEEREAGAGEERQARAGEDRDDALPEADDDGDDSAAENEDASARVNAPPRLDEDHRERGGASVSQLSASILAHIAATSDAATDGPGLLSVDSVQRILSRMAATWCDAITRDSLTLTLQEVLAGRQPGVVLLAVVHAFAPPAHTVLPPPQGSHADGSDDDSCSDVAQQPGSASWEGPAPEEESEVGPSPRPVLSDESQEQNVRQLQSLLNVLPKQCSSRIRQAVSHTGLVGSLLRLIWASYERPLVLRPIGSANVAGRAGSGSANGQRKARLVRKAAHTGGGGLVGGPAVAPAAGHPAGNAAEGTRRRVEILASNVLVRLATQLEWEASEKTPVLDETTARLCSAILQEPSSEKSEKAAVLLAVIANTMVNSMAYMRLYEPSAETMPLRLEQVRLDLKKLRSEPSLVLPRAQTLLQGKMLHFGTCSVPCLARLLVSDASNTAKSAASLCIAIIALLRPAVAVPHAALESIVALLDAEDGSAIFAVEALAALAHVPATQSCFDEQGVVEMVVRMARRGGSSESQASASGLLELLATRRRLYRARCRQAGAVEVLKQMQENGQASVREAAGAALAAVSRTVQDDITAICSSTGYLVLVAFCFFVQLGGVHAVMDVMEVCRDVAHLLSRITSVRRQLPSPSAASIALDFLINDPVAFMLVGLLLAVLPGIFLYLYVAHYVSNSLPATAKGGGGENTRPLQRHRSWLLGFTLRQEVLSSEAGGPSSMYRYVVTEAMPDGPCKHRVAEGDQLMCIDGRDASEMDLSTLIHEARGRPRLTVAQTLSKLLDPLRRLLRMRVVPQSGRGSRVHLKFLRCKRDGRRQTRDVYLIRGNWNGMLDDEQDAENPTEPSANAAVRNESKDHISLFEWISDLRKGSREGSSDGDAVERANAHGNSEGGHARAGEAEEDERVCRICQCTEEEAPENGRLFSPCLCRGTMRYVHHGCLHTWRKMSANASSNTQCDQCSYVYRVERRGLAKFVRVTGVSCRVPLSHAGGRALGCQHRRMHAPPVAAYLKAVSVMKANGTWRLTSRFHGRCWRWQLS